MRVFRLACKSLRWNFFHEREARVVDFLCFLQQKRAGEHQLPEPEIRSEGLWKSLIGHFRVPKNLTFKTRLSAKPLIWKWFLILMQIKLIFTTQVSHLASFWKWDVLELGSGLLNVGYRGKRESKRILSLALPSSRFAFPLFVSPRPAIWTPCKHRLVISYVYVLSAFHPDRFFFPF